MLHKLQINLLHTFHTPYCTAPPLVTIECAKLH